MKPKVHLISSVLLSLIIYYFFRSIAAGFATFSAGVFIDLDHLVDFWLSRPLKPWGIKAFLFPQDYMRKNQKVYAPLHSYELILIIWFTSWYTDWNLILLGIALGFTLHLILDDIGNELKTLSYFLIYRLYSKFRVFKD